MLGYVSIRLTKPRRAPTAPTDWGFECLTRFGRSRWRGGRHRMFGDGSLCGMMQELDLQVIICVCA